VLLLAWSAVATPVVDASYGGHPSVLCGCCAARRRRTALSWRRDCAPPGERWNRESHSPKTHGVPLGHVSTSDPLRESFGEERCTPRGRRRGGLERGRHVGLSPSSCEGSPLTAAPIVVCARTSLAVAPLMTTRAGSTVHARYGRTPCHWRARGSLQTSGARATRGMHRTLAAISGVCSGGRRATPALLCRHHGLRLQLGAAG